MNRLMQYGVRFAAGVCLLVATGWQVQAVTVEKVTVESTVSGVPMSEGFVTANVTCTQGKVFDSVEALKKTVRDDIARLFKTNIFRDVQSDIQTVGSDAVRVVYRVTPKWKAREVKVEGNRLVKTKKITNKITLKKDDQIDMRRISDDEGAIRKLYQDKGYYQTQITHELRKTDADNERELVYLITEEERHKVADVLFNGNTVFTGRELRKKLQTSFSWWSYVFPTGYVDEEKVKSDFDIVTEAYTNKGYLDFKIVNAERRLSSNHKWLTLVLTVQEGRPYTVTALDIAGNKRFSKDDLMKVTRLKSGNTFDSDVEKRDVEKIQNKYEQLGYLDLRVMPRHRLDSASNTVKVLYEIAEGEPSHIRDINISGNEITKDQVIRRELVIQPEDPSNAGKLRTSKSRLMGTNYFESVDITPISTEKSEVKDLDITVKEKKTGQLMIGAGFSSESDILGQFEVTQANFDWKNWPSFTGGGQRLRLKIQAGTQQQDYVLSFMEPWFMDRRLQFDWDLYHHQRDQTYYTQTSTGTMVTFTRGLQDNPEPGTEWEHWRQSLGYRIESVGLSDFDSTPGDYYGKTPGYDGNYTVSSVLYRLTRDTRDRAINPTEGSRVSFSSEVAPEFLGSYSSIYRLELQGAKYFPVNKCVFKIEGEMGTVDNFSGKDPALFDKYFAGGLGSIRGFKRRDVGPIDNYLNPEGGQSLFRGTGELIYPIYEMIKGSVFSDFGNVWCSPYDVKPTDICVSVGLGIQLDLPIGPIRLDYGYPIVINDDPKHPDYLDKTGRFHFNLGYFF